MNIEDYVKLVNKYPQGKSIHLNLSSNFQIGLGIEHKDFCDYMISAGKFTYQSYAPEYNHRDSYLLWHEGAMEIRVLNKLVWWNFERSFDKETMKKFKITVQAHSDPETPSKEGLDIGDIKKHMMLYLIDFAKQKRIPLGIPTIYYNPPFEQDSVLWLPDVSIQKASC